MDVAFPKTRFRTLVIFIWGSACLCAFAIGFFPQLHPTSHPQPSENVLASTATQATPSYESEETKQNQLGFLDADTAIQFIDKYNQLSNRFATHYATMYASQRMDETTLLDVFHRAAQLTGNEAGIILLILALDLGERTPDALVEALSDRAFASRSKLRIRISLLFSYWGQGHPTNAFDAAVRLPERQQYEALQGLIQSGNASVVKRAKEFLARLSDSDTENDDSKNIANAIQAISSKAWLDNRETFLNQIYRAFQSNPQQGIEAAYQIEDSQMQALVISRLLGLSWPSPLDGLNAIKDLDDKRLLENPQERMRYIANLAGATNSQTISSTLDWLTTNLTPNERASLAANFHIRDNIDPTILLDSSFFQSLPDSTVKIRLASRSITSYANSNLNAAIELSKSRLSPIAADSVMPNLIHLAFQAKGREEALQLYSNITSHSARINGLQQLSRSWGQAEPFEFLDWAIKSEEPSLLKQSIYALSENLASLDIDRVRQYETSIQNSELRNAMQLAIGQNLAQSSPIEAIEYAATFEDETSTQQVIYNATSEWAKTEPRNAIEFLLSTYPEQDATQNYVRQSAGSWAQTDPASSAEFFSGIENKTYATIGLVASVERWMQVDDNSAVNFIVNMRAGNTRDSVIERFATNYQLIQRNQDAAIRLIGTISDPVKREMAMDRFVQIAEQN